MATISRENGLAPVELLSAGGVLLASVSGVWHTVVLHRVGPEEWRLPKGKIKGGETPRQAAMREVFEESGIEASPQELLGQTNYQYQDPDSGSHVRKQVLFYAMPISVLQPIHTEQPNFDEGRWVLLTTAQELLTFENEKEIVARAIAYATESANDD